MKPTDFPRFEDYVAHRLPQKAGRARSGSRKAAMDLQCWTCMGGDSPKDCTDSSCWLHPYRPKGKNMGSTPKKSRPAAPRIDAGPESGCGVQ